MASLLNAAVQPVPVLGADPDKPPCQAASVPVELVHTDLGAVSGALVGPSRPECVGVRAHVQATMSAAQTQTYGMGDLSAEVVEFAFDAPLTEPGEVTWRLTVFG